MKTICPDAFWVNSPRAALSCDKIAQHRVSNLVGLKTPDTLYSNSPTEIRKFLVEHQGSLVYKPLKTLPWQDEGAIWMPYTAVVTEDRLPSDEILRSTPGIYQEIVPKQHELRITAMGSRVFAEKAGLPPSSARTPHLLK